MQAIKKGRTTLLITHRLATIQDSDLILVLDKGCLVESGTHAQLLKQGGYYHNLHSQQSR